MALALAACSGGSDDPASVPATGAPTTTTPATSATSVAPATAATAVATSSTTAPRGTATPATTPTTALRSSGVDGGGATAAGRYTYDTTGSFTSPLGRTPRDGDTVLTVEPPTAGRQRGVRAGPGRTVEQLVELRPDGVFLVSLEINDSGFTQQVRPPGPVLAVPSPATVGREWSWQAPTVDGRTTVSSSFRVARTETVDVGGEAVPTAVVEATITTTGDVASTGRQTFWYSDRHRLVVQLTETTEGRVAGLAFGSQTTERLRSLRPA